MNTRDTIILAFLSGCIFTSLVMFWACGAWSMTAANQYAAGFDAGARQPYVMLPPPFKEGV